MSHQKLIGQLLRLVPCPISDVDDKCHTGDWTCNGSIQGALKDFVQGQSNDSVSGQAGAPGRYIR